MHEREEWEKTKNKMTVISILKKIYPPITALSKAIALKNKKRLNNGTRLISNVVSASKCKNKDRKSRSNTPVQNYAS